MYTIIMSFYVVICFGLVITVLLQSSKGEGLAGAFGGGGGVSGAVFGGRGAGNVLSRATTVLAILFLLLAIVLSFMGPGSATMGGGVSAVQKSATQPVQTPAATDVPGTQPVTPAQEDLFGDPAAQPQQQSGDTSGN
jgi:preprotein translocase subunit SecG